jgi:hypothetical protein
VEGAAVVKKDPLHYYFAGWTALDQVPRGTQAVYSVAITEVFRPIHPGSSTATIFRMMTIWKIYYDDDEKQCVLFRFEWTDEMLMTALSCVKYIDS